MNNETAGTSLVTRNATNEPLHWVTRHVDKEHLVHEREKRCANDVVGGRKWLRDDDVQRCRFYLP